MIEKISPDTISIENLADYIEVLGSFPSSDFIFRGEYAKYERRVASAFRDKSTTNFMATVNRYYSMIGHRISDIDKQHFLAFARHHGIATNLIDVSTNPLSSLFFACDDAKENGYVYIYDNRSFIDITNIIEIFPRESIFDLFLSGNKIAVKGIVSEMRRLIEGNRGLLQFTEHGANMVGMNYSNQLFCKIYCDARDKYNEKNQKVIDPITYDELLTNIIGDGVVRGMDLQPNFHKAIYAEQDRFTELLNAICADDIMKGLEVLEEPIEGIMYYVIFLLYCLRVDVLHKANTSDLDNYSELFPPMIYKPEVTVERARLQQGFFIYVPYRAAQGIFTDMEIDMQNITHVQAIEVKNPNKILRELDNVGVNRGTIYGDFDSIARYLTEKQKASRNSL